LHSIGEIFAASVRVAFQMAITLAIKVAFQMAANTNPDRRTSRRLQQHLIAFKKNNKGREPASGFRSTLSLGVIFLSPSKFKESFSQ